MNSETGTPAAETSSPDKQLNCTLVIGPGASGTEICRRVIEYSGERYGVETLQRVQCLGLGFSEASPLLSGGRFSFVKLNDPGKILSEDYAALRRIDAWSWLPETDSCGQRERERYNTRMALFNSAAEIRTELQRIKIFFSEQGTSQVSIFVAADAGDPEGSAMFTDLFALAYDVFGDLADMRYYGILLLPPYNGTQQQRACAYALLKETEFFMRGGEIKFGYPDGAAAVMAGKIFSSGNMFILERNQSEVACAENDKREIESAARFIELMSIPNVSGFVAEQYNALQSAEGFLSSVTHCWSSFGIQGSLNPSAAAGDAIAAHVTASVLDEFFKPVDPALLLRELERINKIPGSPCGTVCADIFRSMYPLYAGNIESVTAGIREKIEAASLLTDYKQVTDVIRPIADTYSSHGIEMFRYGLVSAMEIRASIELEKIKILLLPEIYAMLNDPGRGFHFTLAVLDGITARLSRFHNCFSSCKGKVQMYTAPDLLSCIEEGVAASVEDTAAMASFNYSQFVQICMIDASLFYLEKFMSLLRNVRESVSQKVIASAARLRDDSRLIAEDLSRRLQRNLCDSPGARIQDSANLYEALIPQGVDAAEIAGKMEPASMLAGSEGEEKSTEYTRFKEKLAEAVNSRINIEKTGILPGAKDIKTLLKLMEVLSRPLTNLNSTHGAMTVSATALCTGDDAFLILSAEQGTSGDNRSPRLITGTAFNMSHEDVMISLAPCFKLRDVSLLNELSESYHELIALNKPLHIFNSTEQNALYFPDPLGNEYMEPSTLWSALILLKLVREENGIYILDETLYPIFRETGARMNYVKVITEAGRKLANMDAAGPAGFDLIADAVNMLGMLAKGSGGGIVFRREYASAIQDILAAQDLLPGDGSATGEWKEVFSSTADIAVFLAEHQAVADFILNTIKSIVTSASHGSASGSFVMLPASRIAGTPMPSFESARSFAEYCMECGSTGFYSAIKNILTIKLDEYIQARFVNDAGTQIAPAARIAEFLKAVEPRMPLCVINAVKEMYGPVAE